MTRKLITLIAILFSSVLIAQDNFVSTWAIPSNSYSFTLPLKDYANITINWGDGLSSFHTDGAFPTHTYGSSGTKTITVAVNDGAKDIGEMYMNGHASRTLIRTITNWGEGKWETFDAAFKGATNLTIPATDEPDLTRSGITMSSAFRDCTSLVGTTLNDWNTAAVTNMDLMFNGATSFNQDISSWNTAAVTTMTQMFRGASAFNQNINTSGNSWNTAAVTNMYYMFQGATAFNGNITSWNTAAVTDMSVMFSGATAFNGNITSWNTAAVTRTIDMFSGATSFNQPLTHSGNSWNLEDVTDMTNMFNGATGFSIANYNIFLYSQANNSGINSNITITAASKYSDATSRTYLTETKNWTINDGGVEASVAPTVSSVTSTKANGTYIIDALIPITLTFNEVVNVTGTPQITLETGGTDAVVNYSSGTGSNTLTFNYTVAAGHTSADLDYVATTSLALNSGTIKDTTNNNATLTLPSPGATRSLGANKALVINGAAPTVTGTTVANNNSTIAVTFNQAVYNTNGGSGVLEVSDFALSISGGVATVNATPSSISVSGNVYTLGLNLSGTPSGAETLTVVPSSSSAIYNAAGNAASTTQSNNTVSLNDKVAPTVTGVTSTKANGTYKAGVSIPITITFSEAVTVTGTPQITLETGGTDAVVNYSSGTGTSTLTFNYTVAAGHTSSDLNYVATSSLALNSGTIKDAGLNVATLTLASPAASGSLGANKAIVIDTTVPTVTAVTSTKANGTYKQGVLIPITVTFSEVVNVTGIPQITLETGGTDAVVNYTSGTGSNTLTFNYTVAAGHTSSDLDYKATTSLGLPEHNPGTPVYMDTSGNTSKVTISGNYAYMADGNSGLTIIDISNPTNPGNPVYMNTNGSGRDISVVGDYAYVADGDSGLAIIDISDPTNPGNPVYMDTNGSAFGITVSGNYAYIGDWTSGLAIIDISDPTSPGSPVYMDTTGNASGIAVNGNYVYLADNASGLAIIDISNPASPGSPVYKDTTGAVYDVTIIGNYAYLADASSGLAIIDISDPTNPGNPVYKDTNDNSVGIDVVGNYAYLANFDSGLAIIDVSDPTNPGTLIYKDTSGRSYGVSISDNYAYVADDLSGLAVIPLNRNLVQDAGGNNATLTLASPAASGSLGNSKAIVIDTTAPTVTAVTSTKADGTYKQGVLIPITVTFSEVVNVTGTPQITLETGGADAVVNYTSGTGTNTLTFNYIVAAGHTSADLDYKATSSLALNSGTIKNAGEENATLTLASPAASGSLGNSKALVIDTTVPTISSVTSTKADGTYKAGVSIPITITFSEVVNVT